MTEYADLEIGLYRRDAAGYALEMRLNRPDSATENRVSATIQLNLAELRNLELDETAYGRQLMTSLCTAPKVQDLLVEAQMLEMPLRLQLFIDRSAPELHALHWETLLDLNHDSPLATNENILFSRYLNSLDHRPVRLHPQDTLRALVVIANPSNIKSRYGLGELNAAAEVARARASLGQIPMTAIAERGRATLANISQHLREAFDILYLVCHGKSSEGQAYLFLENEEGETDIVPGAELVTHLVELRDRPHLVVLASCQSAGSEADARTDDEGVLSALGPRLAEAGIPAVLAMQGNVMMGTLAEFMPAFFAELQESGQIDLAMTIARREIRDKADWWAPTLFMRLKGGRLWYRPGFADDQDGLEKWPALLGHISRERCIPILGPGLTETLLGSRQEIARRWADTYQFPMAPHDREDLPQVSQYLAINQDYAFPRDQLMKFLRQELLQRYGDQLPEEAARVSLEKLMAQVSQLHQAGNPAEPHRVLAELPLPIYITTNPDNMLYQALQTAGKKPELEICRWNEDIEWLPSIYDDEPDYRPTPQRPLIYQIFGRLDEPDSLVLTEDDYFEYLIGVTSKKDLIPGVVRRKLVDAALLFLGFRMDDWQFRVLFRSIMSQQGGRRRKKYAHVAAQIAPEEGRILKPDGARRYLETYFQDSDISIFWGSANDFIQTLKQQWEATK